MMTLSMNSLASLILVLFAAYHPLNAQEQAGVDADALSHAQEKVRSFELLMLKQISLDDFNREVLDSEENQNAVRAFFKGLNDTLERLAAIDLLDNRYVYIVNRELAAELLGPLLRDDDPLVRTRAVRAVAYNRCGAKYAKELIAMLTDDAPADTLVKVAAAMGTSEHQEFSSHLESLIGHSDAEVRLTALSAITGLKLKTAFDWNVRLLKDDAPSVRRRALQNLGGIQNPRTAAVVEGFLEDKEAVVRQTAIQVLGQLKSHGSAEKIAKRLSDEHHHVRSHAAQVLGNLQATEHADAVADLLQDPSIVVRRYATIALGAMGESRYIERLRPLVSDEDEQIRKYATESIAQLSSR